VSLLITITISLHPLFSSSIIFISPFQNRLLLICEIGIHLFPRGHALTVAFREVLLGITGKDFVILAASKAAMRGPTILKAEDDKTRQLSQHTLMAFSGEAGDTGTLR
jgi:hypothetical protein